MKKNSLDSKQPPWKKPKPKGKGFKLTPEQIQEARERAEAAGRRYPNLVEICMLRGSIRFYRWNKENFCCITQT